MSTGVIFLLMHELYPKGEGAVVQVLQKDGLHGLPVAMIRL